jgi:hypothetical protein
MLFRKHTGELICIERAEYKTDKEYYTSIINTKFNILKNTNDESHFNKSSECDKIVELVKTQVYKSHRR